MKQTSRITTLFAAAVMPTLFSIQSIDTMKDSRDMARSLPHDSSYESTIDREMSVIAGTGANYAAIDVPYDDEFVPLLTAWVSAARAHHLHVWFRGNLSGWEGWFNYPQIGREEHVKGIERFILAHGGLFQDGDVFSGCPECENGTADGGDPRRSGDVDGYRKFLINEFQVWSGDFARMGKDVSVISSMNLDVAKLVMDRQTTAALGGLVAVDHYATSTAQFEHDLVALHESSDGRIILGEFGGPIPDINGSMDDAGQAGLVRGLLDAMHRHADIVVGANYWTLRSGSSALVTDGLARKPALTVLADYFSAPYISGTIRDDAGRTIGGRVFAVRGAASSTDIYAVGTDMDGTYRLFVPQGSGLDRATQGLGGLVFADPGGAYATTTVAGAGMALKDQTDLDVTMKRVHVSLIQRFLQYLHL